MPKHAAARSSTAIDLERLRKTLADPIDHGLNEHRRLLDIEVREQDHELVAAHPRHDVGVASTGPQAAGHLHEQPVTVNVPERVVDVLEAIEVDAEDGDGQARAARARECELELLSSSRRLGSWVSSSVVASTVRRLFVSSRRRSTSFRCVTSVTVVATPRMPVVAGTG